MAASRNWADWSKRASRLEDGGTVTQVIAYPIGIILLGPRERTS
jgi:hypothetical protein